MKQRKRLEKLLMGDRNFGKLISIHAFWKKDKPTGFGLSFDIDEDICALLADMFEENITCYKGASALDRLDQICVYGEQLVRHKEMVLKFPGCEICLLGNVWFLEYLGLIDADDFNGLMMIWENSNGSGHNLVYNLPERYDNMLPAGGTRNQS